MILKAAGFYSARCWSMNLLSSISWLKYWRRSRSWSFFWTVSSPRRWSKVWSEYETRSICWFKSTSETQYKSTCWGADI